MANLIQTYPQTPLVFQPSGRAFPSGVGIPSGVIINFTPDSLGTGIGYISNQYDLGPGPRTTLFDWRGNATLTNGANVGGSVDVYISTSNSVYQDGKLPQTNGQISSLDKRRNLMFCGSLTCDSTGSNPDPAIAVGLIEIFSRYISVAWFNNTGAPLGTGNCFILTPVPDEIE